MTSKRCEFCKDGYYSLKHSNAFGCSGNDGQCLIPQVQIILGGGTYFREGYGRFLGGGNRKFEQETKYEGVYLTMFCPSAHYYYYYYYYYYYMMLVMLL